MFVRLPHELSASPEQLRGLWGSLQVPPRRLGCCKARGRWLRMNRQQDKANKSRHANRLPTRLAPLAPGWGDGTEDTLNRTTPSYPLFPTCSLISLPSAWYCKDLELRKFESSLLTSSLESNYCNSPPSEYSLESHSSS